MKSFGFQHAAGSAEEACFEDSFKCWQGWSDFSVMFL